MDDILQAYGDVLEDQQVNYNVLGLIVGLIFLIYGLAELLL